MFLDALFETQFPMKMVARRYRITIPRSMICKFIVVVVSWVYCQIMNEMRPLLAFSYTSLLKR